ncbi:MAG: DUF255 domain-containing protein [Nanoarchaeota archaeon]|mgnify:CR=1 FL=1
MINFQKNNLDKSSSDYLRQHKDNPIFWQEFSKEVIDYARSNNKPVFISVGYSTCHWCHVMASEAFSDIDIAKFMNENFISIKVDKELRPDIDNYLMSYIAKTQGHGGWPLNVILTPDLKPFIAFTYLPVNEKNGLPPLIDVLNFSLDIFKNNKDSIKDFNIDNMVSESVEESKIIEYISSSFDEFAGGFGIEPKFPPHNTLLFLLSYYEKSKDVKVKSMIEKTLDMISMRGLQDHLQGGFFRYCVDPSWSIPHFEKMLYDQAMLLWIFSSAFKIFNKEEYKIVADKIVKCLDESFLDNDLYYSAIDADTDHHEGLTYLWYIDELKKVLSNEEFIEFSEVYELDENFDDKIHLIKKENKFLSNIENKLLKYRNSKQQPFRDKKFITSWNSLVGIALLMHYRFTDNISSKDKAVRLFANLLNKHYKNFRLFHSSVNSDEFLEDYSAFLLFSTFIYEDLNKYKDLISEIYSKMKSFNKNNVWHENLNSDFIDVKANTFDHPYPSSVSLAELAVLRSNIILGMEYSSKDYSLPINHDFFNLSVFISNGNYHLIHSKTPISWNDLPLNSIITHSDDFQDCFNNICKEFNNKEELIKNLKD